MAPWKVYAKAPETGCGAASSRLIKDQGGGGLWQRIKDTVYEVVENQYVELAVILVCATLFIVLRRRNPD